ncbi:MAG: 4-hydroxy-3-methylbut-2-enyl diphosphate reductase [Limnochordales bacterium]|nr:4-hydroxy-3-methylbut-2-enyl diphosphate reductase [Limnochordales bacterium]
MEVIPVTPRGYCYGVVDAIQLVREVARDPGYPRPIQVLGQIVHNRHVVEELDRLGVITLDGPDRLKLLEKVEGGTVIFTAHGISPAVREAAIRRGLRVVDATCPDVARTHELVRKLVAQGYELLYVGKRNHPEPEGVIGEAPEHIHLVEQEGDLDQLPEEVQQRLATRPVAVTTQTTLSQWDTIRIIAAIRQRYPDAEVYNEICRATQTRQEAAVEAARQVDLVLVVGDRRSNNSNRLVQVVREIAGKPAYLIDDENDIRPEWLQGVTRVAVTAGSSTPSHITRAVIERLRRWEA